MLVLVAALLAVIYVVTAVAADRPRCGVVYWLFDRSRETYPRTQAPTIGEWLRAEREGLELVRTDERLVPQVLTVSALHGEVAGRRFEMQAFFKK